MIKEIVKDTEFLSKASKGFNFNSDKQVIRDLLDTAKAHKEDCAGLAAVQIGCLVKAFVVKNPKTENFNVYINPTIVARSPIKSKCIEGCLSLDGKREVVRNEWVKIMYSDINNKTVIKRLDGIEGQAVQHEYDHLNGVLI